MATQSVVIAKVDPTAQDHAPITFASIYFNMLAEENKPGSDYVGVTNLEDEKPPVAN
ncbi:unannotated protein [freshwater metagenome]|uniref:Unannotated protein n=1 Tax=freshwater metagenome TaxID=449393 RepID=A0A6J7AHR7_9ZZZZ